MQMARKTSNQTMQLTATRTAFTVIVTKLYSFQFSRGVGSRS
ncbi:MAG: hypothetical protein QOG67_591 [Verrucomicrobiota bacterium]|jgi:hypothetical protein